MWRAAREQIDACRACLFVQRTWNISFSCGIGTRSLKIQFDGSQGKLSKLTFRWQRDATWRKSIGVGSWWRLIFNITMMEEKAEKAQIAASINILLQTIWSSERQALQILFFTINRFQRNKNGGEEEEESRNIEKVFATCKNIKRLSRELCSCWQFQFVIFISTPHSHRYSHSPHH